MNGTSPGVASASENASNPLASVSNLDTSKEFWAKLDAKIPYDWENEEWLSTAELQLGYHINESLALYADGLVGIGKDRPYDGGVGVGLRLKY